MMLIKCLCFLFETIIVFGDKQKYKETNRQGYLNPLSLSCKDDVTLLFPEIYIFKEEAHGL